MVAQQSHGHAWYAERDRRRSTVCSWFLRERLRRVDCHDQRPVLVCWIEETLLDFFWLFRLRRGSRASRCLFVHYARIRYYRIPQPFETANCVSGTRICE